MAKTEHRGYCGIIGISDEGFPVVTADHVCPFWEGQPDASFSVKECWYCKHADFRKSERICLSQSICRNKANRVLIREQNGGNKER